MTAQDFTVIVVIQIVLRSLYFVPRLETEAQSVCENLAFLKKTHLLYFDHCNMQ